MPDPEYRLTAAERAVLCSDLNLDALEDLLRALPAEARANVLRFARDWSLGKPGELLATFPEIELPQPAGRKAFAVPTLEDLEFDELELQRRLERVLSPRLGGRSGDSPEA